MVFVMVYMMICYNIALNIGSMNNSVFLSALHEFVIMAPVAFVLDFFFVGHIAKKTAFCIVNPKRENPFHLVLAISAVSVAWMCPLMSLAATILFVFCSDRYSVSLHTGAQNQLLRPTAAHSFQELFRNGCGYPR